MTGALGWPGPRFAEPGIQIATPPKPTGLWRNADFVRLWAGQTVSTLGTLMGALQLAAVLVLDASPFQMGLLAALRVAPGLIFGLAAGVWVDRRRRCPILIAADMGRAAMRGSIPIAFLLGAMLAGSLVAGMLREVVGLRLTLVVGASAGLFGALWLAVSPVRHVRGLPPSRPASRSPADAA